MALKLFLALFATAGYALLVDVPRRLLLPAALVLFRGRLGLVDLPPAGVYAVSLLGMLAYPLQHVSVRIVERVGRAVRCRGKKRRLAVPGLLERDEGC